MTNKISKLNVWTFKNVGEWAPVYLENEPPPYSFMRLTTGGISTTPTPKGFRVITAGTRMGHKSQTSFQPGKIVSSNIKVGGEVNEGRLPVHMDWFPHTSQGT